MPDHGSFAALGYRYFLAVAETGSVRAASRVLNVAASAISRQLILLEDQLGLVLFDRSGRHLTLSPAGEILKDGLITAAHGHEDTLERLSALRGLKRGRVRIATVESISVEVLPRLLMEFSARFPGIEATITVAGSDRVTEMVLNHEADVGFTFNPSSLDGLAIGASRDFQIGAVLSPRHPLAEAKALTLAQCLDHAVAWPAQGLSLRTILMRIPAARKIRPVYECNSLRLMAALAREGNCIAFQTIIGIGQELKAGTLRWIPLTDRRLPIDRFTMVHRKGQQGRPATNAFLETAAMHIFKAAPVRKNSTKRGR
ncbi:LysR family transcriptional regulator [Aestuariivirga sp.]|uniref:LysR family transcriptional regulator n=1 Tax=Aestuariivirga sp. TaxID=2650926 RepID=UPI0039E57365